MFAALDSSPYGALANIDPKYWPEMGQWGSAPPLTVMVAATNATNHTSPFPSPLQQLFGNLPCIARNGAPDLLNPATKFFTHCFLSVFGLVWAVMFGIPLILTLRKLLNTPTNEPKTRSGQFAFLAAIWAPVFLVLHIIFSPGATVVPADLVLSAFMLLASAVHRIQDGKVAVCCQELLLFWMVEAVVYVGWAVDAFLSHTKIYDFWMLIAGAVCAVLALILEIFNVERNPQNYYNDSSVFSKVVIGFANPVLEKCRKEGITQSDFTKVPVDVEASTIGRKLAMALAAKMGDYNARPDSHEVTEEEGRYKVVSALFTVSGTNIGLSMLFRTLSLVCDLYVPIMVMNFLRSLTKYRSGDLPLYTSYYVALQFAVIPGATISLQTLSRIQSTFTDTKVRAALLTTIYRKAFNLSPKSREKYESSKIMTLTSVDTDQVLSLTDGLAEMATMPIMLVVAILQLWKLLGYSFVGGVIVYVLLLPAQSLMTSRIGDIMQGLLRVADERSKLTSNVIRSIKSLKLYGWERPFAKLVESVRANQLGYLRSFMIVRVLLTVSFNCASDFVAIAIFTFFLWIRQGTLSAEVVFPSLLLLQMVSLSTMSLPMLLVQWKRGLTSCGRLYVFFMEKDHLRVNYNHQTTGAQDFDSTVVQAKKATVSWNGDLSDDKVVLQNVDWEAKRGDFVCIVGRVGAGKSAMLRALCGELCITEGEINLYGSLAYSAQESWLQNMKLKDNVLFGQVYEEEWYNRVIEACELTKDIADMPEGHETNVGERGISLSGGQKARVALARAVYSRADIVILDDVLSAVDEHVSKALVTKLFSCEGLLANRTVILATNNIKVLSHSSRIVALADKQVVETSSFPEIVQRGESSSIYQLIREFGHADDLKKSHEEVGDRRSTLKAKIAADPTFFVPTTTEKPAEFSKFDVYAQKSDEEEEKTVSSIRPYIRYYFESHPVSTWVGLFFMLGTVLFRNSIIAYLGVVVSHNFQDLWSARWYFTTYAGIAMGAVIALALNMYFIELMMSLRNSQTLHDQMLWSVMRAPMKFFDKTPLGRLINRFTGDLASVDNGFAEVGTSVLRASLNVLVSLVPILIGAPQLLFVVVPLGWWANSIRTLYVPAQRKVTRIYSAANSPVLSHIEDSMKGQSIVRSFGQTARFEDIFVDYVNYWAQASFFRTTLSRWISVRISLISLILSFGAALGVTQLIGWNIVGVSYAGVILNYCERSGIMIGQTIQAIAAAEVDGVALERIYEYIDMEQEAPYHIDATSPSPSWPAKGEITFDNLTARYSEDGPDVLKNLTLKIKSGEKIGVVGRTGSGKSTLTLAIFRMLEAHKGAIEMDKINTSILGLGDLRSRLSIVPQDAQIFDSSVRDNLDPLHTVDDARLWEVLELCHLKAHFEKHDGLDTVLTDSGSQLSRGQAQLLCLGRALVHQSKILVLDEATASVDHETDKIIQETIRTNMAGRTIITVAHRLNTIMDSDRVLVLEKGEIKEFDTPQNLLDAKGLFYGLHNVEEKLEREESAEEPK